MTQETQKTIADMTLRFINQDPIRAMEFVLNASRRVVKTQDSPDLIVLKHCAEVCRENTNAPNIGDFMTVTVKLAEHLVAISELAQSLVQKAKGVVE